VNGLYRNVVIGGSGPRVYHREGCRYLKMSLAWPLRREDVATHRACLVCDPGPTPPATAERGEG
jgi:hypothetical protein